jgi:hypothetical protein
MAETESTTSDTGPPLPLVELCLRSVEGLVLHRPQVLPAVAASLGVLPRSAVSQFVESLLLKSMTDLYPLPYALLPSLLLLQLVVFALLSTHLSPFRFRFRSLLATARDWCQ